MDKGGGSVGAAEGEKGHQVPAAAESEGTREQELTEDTKSKARHLILWNRTPVRPAPDAARRRAPAAHGAAPPGTVRMSSLLTPIRPLQILCRPRTVRHTHLPRQLPSGLAT